MKKLLMAVAAFGMLLASCAKDDAVAPVEQNEALVSFCVNAPSVTTRYGEGEEATTLYWAVYNADGSIVTALQGSKPIQLSTTVDLKLIQGREYDVLFWAADEQAPYSINWEDKTMTVGDALTANEESYDAFYKYEELGVVSGALSKTVELTRPFAQLNIGVADTTDAENAGLVVAKTQVKVSDVYTKLDFVTGFVSEPKEVTFILADKAEGTIEANGSTYDHIAMNYILVGKESEQSQSKKLVGVELTINDEGLTRNYTSVPVERNYRTNIVGNILTSPAQFNVVILPGFEENIHPFTPEDLLNMAAQTGGEYTMEEEVDLAGSYLAIATNFTLNMNGNKMTTGTDAGYGILVTNGTTIINDANIESLGAGINVQAGADVVFNGGNVNIKTDNQNQRYIFYAAQEGTTITINDGTFVFENPHRQRSYICAHFGAKVYVKGGEFGAPCTHPRWKQNPIYTEEGGEVIITGGIFGFDPTAWVAEGYKAIQKDGKYMVVAEKVDAVASTSSELSEAIANGDSNVVLTDDIEWRNAISNDANINLNGNTFEATYSYALNNNADLTMTGGTYEMNSTYGHIDARPTTAEGSVLTFEDMHFVNNHKTKTNGTCTNRTKTMLQITPNVNGAKAVAKFTNCTFDNASVYVNGMSSASGSIELVFENCTFNAMTSSSLIEVKNYITGTIKVIGCTFNLECTSASASAVGVTMNSSTVDIVAANNKFNAVAATPYTYDASKGEDETYNVKIHGTPENIKFINVNAGSASTVTETGTVKSGIAQ